MSSVRMCDRCGVIFSENSEGWSTYQGTQFKRIDGKRVAESVYLDSCRACSPDSLEVSEIQPNLPEGDTSSFARLALEKENKELKEKLEANETT